MTNLRHGKYFGGGTTVFLIYVIEYQHRGLPHAHIACGMSNAPDHKQTDVVATWIDENISAELPDFDEGSPPNDILYKQLVKDHMSHKCAPLHVKRLRR